MILRPIEQIVLYDTNTNNLLTTSFSLFDGVFTQSQTLPLMASLT